MEDLKNFFIGGLSSGISRTFVAPIELYRLQRQNKFIPNSTLKAVYKKEGISYFWKGNGVNCIRAFPQFAINYTIFQKLKKFNSNNFVNGCISGSISMIIIYPLETTRTFLSLQTNNNKYSGIYDVIKKNNIRNLYRGLQMSMIGFGSWSGFQWGFLHYYNDLFKNTVLDTKLVTGGLSAITAVSITYPTDLIRRRLQLQGFDNSVPKYNGIKDAIFKIYKHEGIRGFYRGLHANYIKSAPLFSIQFFIIDKIKKWK